MTPLIFLDGVATGRSVGRSSQRLRGQSIVDAKRAPTPFRVPWINGSYEPCITRHAPETNTTRIGALSVSVLLYLVFINFLFFLIIHVSLSPLLLNSFLIDCTAT